MLDYRKYKKADYFELTDFKNPQNGRFFYLPSFDGLKLRVGLWDQKSRNAKARGTILLQQGHNEFIEKYFEVIQEFIYRNFNVICFDWRGQGLSQRLNQDKHKSFVKSFDFHDHDIKFLLEKIINPYLEKPLIGVGHSMGGCLMLSALNNHKNEFDYAILSAPMLGFKYEFLLKILAKTSSFILKDDDYFVGSKPNMGIETKFIENELTTDPERYERTLKLVRINPDLRLWGTTNAFVKSVIDRFKLIRKPGWIKDINTNLLVLNSLEDKVVDSRKTIQLLKENKNIKIKNFKNVKHEIFMEKDVARNKLWNHIDNFLCSI